MKTYWACVGCLGLLAWMAAVAQAEAPSAADRDRLAEVLRASAAVLRETSSYQLDVQTRWSSGGGGQNVEGDNQYRLLVEQPRKFRIEIKPASAPSADVFCVSDGRLVTTLLASQGLYSQAPVARADLGLKRNVFVAMNLAGSSVDVMLRADMPQFVLGQVSQVQRVGIETLDGVEVEHFRMHWGPREVELWVSTGQRPLLRQFTQTTTVDLGNDETAHFQATSRLNWQLDAKHSADLFQLRLPAEARLVDDIYRALSGASGGSLTGQPAPQVAATGLDGKPMSLTPGQGQNAMVLIFWASWCVPSVQEMPAISEFVAEYKSRGVTFFAVNVGDELADLGQLVARQRLQSTVVADLEGDVTAAFDIHSLPAVVVVDAENVVRAVLQGNANETRPQLRAELDRLLGR